MSAVEILVTLGGVALMILIAWYFWLSEKRRVTIVESAEGVQEINIQVKGGYTPDVIVVKAGKPVRLNFTRQETAVCSEQVLLSDFNRVAALPTGRTVPVEFTPEKPGEYGFQCQMGMLKGRLVVEA